MVALLGFHGLVPHHSQPCKYLFQWPSPPKETMTENDLGLSKGREPSCKYMLRYASTTDILPWGRDTQFLEIMEMLVKYWATSAWDDQIAAIYLKVWLDPGSKIGDSVTELKLDLPIGKSQRGDLWQRRPAAQWWASREGCRQLATLKSATLRFPCRVGWNNWNF